MHVRHPLRHEQRDINVLVQTVVDEVYGGLWTSAPVPIGDTNWDNAWVSEQHGRICGVGLAEHDRIEDLWVARAHRNAGLGSLLLASCEADIRRRGFKLAHLHVVHANQNAIHFYLRHQWSVIGEKPHSRFPITMVEMSKPLHV